MRHLSLLTCIGLFGGMAFPAQADQQFHVAVDGNDQAAGTVGQPLKSMEGARDRIRSYRATHPTPEAIEVVVHAGRYELERTLLFTAEDAGTAEAPIHYRAEGNVVLSGGMQLPAPNSQLDPNLLRRFPAAARSHLVGWDLRALGLEEAAKRLPRSLGTEMLPASMQLIQGNKALPLASWPQSGWAQAKQLPGSANEWQLPKNTPAWSESLVMAHGFWESDARDAFLPAIVQRSGSDTTLRLTTSLMENQPECRCRIENVASQLDQPGEWYLDESQNQVYYWPLADQPMKVLATRLETVVSLYDVNHVRLEGFAIEAARVMGIEIAGGEDVGIDNCVVRHHGNVGINVYYGREHHIQGCKIHHCGSSAIRVEGGDFETWTPANHRIDHNVIHDFGTLYMARRAGVDIHGLGITVRNNQVHHGPDIGIQLRGNELLVERNEIHDVCRETDDTGAIYLGHNPTYRGNVIRHNFVHDIGNYASSSELRRTGVMAIYLDDFASGTTVSGNVMRNTVRGIAIGGGRDNIIEYNVILQAMAGIQIDCRGTTWAESLVKPEQGTLKNLVRSRLAEFPNLGTHYEGLTSWGQDEPEVAKGNVVRFNAVDGIRPVDLFDGLNEKLVTMDRNENQVDKIFVNAKGNNFTLRQPYDGLYQAIPFASIGVKDLGTDQLVARTQSTK